MKTLATSPWFWMTAWCLWLTGEFWAFGDLSYLYLHDNADQVLPFTAWITRDVSNWFSGRVVPALSGVDRLSTTAWVTLSHPLFYLLPGWLAHGLFLFIQRWLMGFFAFLLLRDALKLRPIHAALGAMAYTLVHLEQGEIRMMHLLNEPGLPMLMWAFWRVSTDRITLGGVGLMGAIGVVVGLAMDPVAAMPFFFPAALLFAWIVRDDLFDKASYFRLLVLVILCGLIAVPFKLPGLYALLQNAPFGHRADWDAGLGMRDAVVALVKGRVLFLAGWWLVLLMVVPWFFTRSLRGRTNVGLLILLFLGLVVGPVLQALMYVYNDLLGFVRGMDFSRFNRIAPLALLAAAASGLAVIETRRGATFGRPMVFSLVALGMMLATSYQVKTSHWQAMRLHGQNWRTVFKNAEIDALARKAAASPEPFRAATVGAFHQSHPMYLLSYGLEIADGYSVMYPNRYQLYWGEVIGPLMKSEDTFRGHFVGWGSRVYLFHSQVPALEGVPQIPFSAWYNLNLLSLANVNMLVSHKPIDDQRLVAIPQVWSEEHRDAWAARPFREKLTDYFSGRNPGARRYIYENPEAFSRMFTVPSTRVFANQPALFEELGRASRDDIAAAVFLEADTLPASMAERTSGPGKVEDAAFERESARAVVTSEQGTWVVFSSQYYRWWEAEANGRKLDVVPAYGAFMAVHVPAGNVTLEWKYRPPYGFPRAK